MAPAIEVEDLVKRYGAVEAVRGLTFSVRRGEFFGFLGPNGAGKSTTINMLVTLLRPTAGRAQLNGYDVVREPDAVRRSIGVIFQDPSLDDRLTARENMELHAVVYRVPRAKRRRRIEAMLRMVELWERRDDLVKNFSRGMKRRLEIARGLLHAPVILFLDEPTVGLDPQSRRRIWEYIADLRRTGGTTVFMSTHYMDEAEQCDRVAIIDHGRLIACDSPQGLRRQVGGDVIIVRCDDPRAAARRVREELPDVHSVSVHDDDGELHVEVADGEAFVPRVVLAIGETVRGVHVRPPTLDDVFLKLTGRALRDEESDWVEGVRERMRARARR